MTALKRIVATAGNPDCGRLGHEVIKGAVEHPSIVKHLLGLNPISVSAGGAHTAVVTDEGSLYTFGLNNVGQAGHSTGEEVVVPSEVPLPEPALAVSAGNFHTLVLTKSGLVWAFGDNGKGQLGVGSALSTTAEPRLISALKNEKIIGICAGAEHSLAVTSSGEVYSWGCSEYGRLGHATPAALKSSWTKSIKNEYKPRLIRSLETQKIVQVSAGHMHSGVVSEEGRGFLFGSGRFHQLGRKSDLDSDSPIELQGPRLVSQVACGGAHTLAVTAGGVIASFGADQGGCLGRSKEKNADIRVPEPIPKVVAEQVSSGWKHSAAIAPGGRLMTWGWGGSQGTAFSLEKGGGGGGQLGLGNDFDYWAPASVTHLATTPGGGGGIPQFSSESGGHQLWRVLQVSCGMNHTAAIFEGEIPV